MKLSLLLALLCFTSPAQITTSQYDNARTGAYLHETVLTPANVNPKQFGKVGEFHVDGDVYAQPLYIPGLAIPGKGTHDVLFIATEADSVYAFDAKAKTSAPLWHTAFTNPAAGITSVPSASVFCPFIDPQIGITSTPVIDPTTQTLYVLARTRERDRSGTERLWQRLHALDLTTGREKFGGPVVIKASVNGPKALFGLSQGTIDFSPLRENPRAGLLLVNGQVVLTWASSCDVGPYYGWIMTYDAHTLKQTGVFNTSPGASQSGIWQSDVAPAADSAGNMYVLTGNGFFDAARGGRDYGDSVLKLAITKNGPVLRDWFTPFNEAQLNREDGDLGSGGPLVLPQQAAGGRRLLIAAGKGDALYVLDRDRLGRYRPNDNSQIVQMLHECGTGSFGAPAYWNGHVYYLCREDRLKDFALTHGLLVLQKTAARTFVGPGATPTISANGTKNGIVWAVDCTTRNVGLAVLHAYDATDVSRELYNSNEAEGDQAGTAIRFTIPTVADGDVFIGTKGEVDIYGLRLTRGAGPKPDRSAKHAAPAAMSSQRAIRRQSVLRWLVNVVHHENLDL